MRTINISEFFLHQKVLIDRCSSVNAVSQVMTKTEGHYGLHIWRLEVPSGPFPLPAGFMTVDHFLFVVCRAERWLLLCHFHTVESDDHWTLSCKSQRVCSKTCFYLMYFISGQISFHLTFFVLSFLSFLYRSFLPYDECHYAQHVVVRVETSYVVIIMWSVKL